MAKRSKKQLFQQKREFMQKGTIVALCSVVSGLIHFGLFTQTEKKSLQKIYPELVSLTQNYKINTQRLKEKELK